MLLSELVTFVPERLYQRRDPAFTPPLPVLLEGVPGKDGEQNEQGQVGSATGQPSFEVTISRQRQIELMLADVAPRLAPRLLDKPLQPGQDLALSRIDPERWCGEDLLHRRAVLLAHYYCLRAAGLISGMTKFDHRRNRDECAQRCTALVDACAELLNAADPLRDQISAYALGYRQQYDASYGRDPTVTTRLPTH